MNNNALEKWRVRRYSAALWQGLPDFHPLTCRDSKHGDLAIIPTWMFSATNNDILYCRVCDFTQEVPGFVVAHFFEAAATSTKAFVESQLQEEAK